MPEARRLSRAPIKEAIIDFRVRPRADVAAEDFEELREGLQSRFPKASKQRREQVIIELTSQGPLAPTVQHEPLGLILQTADDRLLVQFRVDGFTLNRLPPYSSWEELRPLALELWNMYLGAARPERLIRLALRYVNELKLPRGQWDLADYLRAAPTTPEGIPQQVVGFASRVTVVEEDRGNAVHIGQVLRQEETATIFVLDVDAFRDGDWNPNDPAVLEVLDDLRRLKNLIFFNMLTERTLRLFE